MKVYVAALILLAFVLSATTGVSQTQHALLIGINMYQPEGTTAERRAYRGPVRRPGLQHPHDREGVQLAAVADKGLGRRPWHRLGVRPGFVLALETVTRQDAFGEDHQAGTVGARLAQPAAHEGQVVRPLAQPALHLNACNFPRCHGWLRSR